MTDSEIIDQIKTIRSNNNGVWMRLLEIALLCAPDQTKALLCQITVNDTKVSELLKRLAK
jgi:hypothetical protein